MGIKLKATSQKIRIMILMAFKTMDKRDINKYGEKLKFISEINSPERSVFPQNVAT